MIHKDVTSNNRITRKIRPSSLSDNSIESFCAMEPQCNAGEPFHECYKRKAMKLHPDRNMNDPYATKIFQDMTNAYEMAQSVADNTQGEIYCRHKTHNLDSNPNIHNKQIMSSISSSEHYDVTFRCDQHGDITTSVSPNSIIHEAAQDICTEYTPYMDVFFADNLVNQGETFADHGCEDGDVLVVKPSPLMLIQDEMVDDIKQFAGNHKFNIEPVLYRMRRRSPSGRDGLLSWQRYLFFVMATLRKIKTDEGNIESDNEGNIESDNEGNIESDNDHSDNDSEDSDTDSELHDTYIDVRLVVLFHMLSELEILRRVLRTKSKSIKKFNSKIKTHRKMVFIQQSNRYRVIEFVIEFAKRNLSWDKCRSLHFYTYYLNTIPSVLFWKMGNILHHIRASIF